MALPEATVVDVVDFVVIFVDNVVVVLVVANVFVVVNVIVVALFVVTDHIIFSCGQ